MSYLLNFKLTLARPVDRDMTTPRANNKEYLDDFAGGAGRMDRAFSMAINNQLQT